MCDVNCFKWGAKNLKDIDIFGKRIIEVGSYDVNGSLRYIVELLKPSEYVGVDIIEGSGVDLICPAENLVEKFGEQSFDVVLATCILEHLIDWRKAISNIKNVCKPNGIILIIVPFEWPFHEYPIDFWRYSKEDINNIFSDCEILNIEEDLHKPSLVYAKIRKPNNFVEKNLADYKLFSIITGKRMLKITNNDTKSFHAIHLIFKQKLKDFIFRLGKFIFSKI